jgi:hypothetical protein
MGKTIRHNNTTTTISHRQTNINVRFFHTLNLGLLPSTSPQHRQNNEEARDALCLEPQVRHLYFSPVIIYRDYVYRT